MKKLFRQFYAFSLTAMLIIPYTKKPIPINNESISATTSVVLQNTKPGTPPPSLPEPIPIEGA